MTDDTLTRIQVCLVRLNAGDASAREELIVHSCNRLRRLTRKMLQDYRRLNACVETDDVLQEAMLRLWHALQAQRLTSSAEFFRLATLEIRRQLIDLVRRYFGPHGAGTRELRVKDGGAREASPRREPSERSHDPADIDSWTQFHEQVAVLPANERQVVELLWYHGLTQAEAAGILNTSLATVKRWWLSARLRLHERLPDGLRWQ